MRKTLTDKGVQALKPRPGRSWAYPDPELVGHYVRVHRGGKSFCAVARNPVTGKQVWTTIGAADVMDIEQAREFARECIRRVRSGQAAVEPKAETFAAVVENWRKRHVEANGLRSAREINRLLEVHVLPHWREREFISIGRGDIARLLDGVQDRHSARQADMVLTVVRSIMNWYATRTDDYRVPTVRNMRRQSPYAQARARLLTDEEVRKIWTAAESSGVFGSFCKIALLTAQRKAKILGMRWSDISDAGEWTIPKAPREKDNGGPVLVLPPMAIQVIRALPQLRSNPYVFAGHGPGPLRGVAKCKHRLDKASGVTGWTVHDLRRCARSLMARAGVLSEHAERVMGHAIGGIEQIYDRHSYSREKADALVKLAALVHSIVHPPADNVLPIVSKRKNAR